MPSLSMFIARTTGFRSNCYEIRNNSAGFNRVELPESAKNVLMSKLFPCSLGLP
jgi:hypothetical protein